MTNNYHHTKSRTKINARGWQGAAAILPGGWQGLKFSDWMKCSWSGLTIVLLVLALREVRAEDSALTTTRTEVRFAFSKTMFVGVNENDARASVKAYAQSIGDQNGIYVNRAPELLDGTNAIVQALQLKRADMLVLTADEFFTLEQRGLEGPLLLSKVKGVVTEDYLLLSRDNGTIRRAEDLKGCSLNFSSESRGALSRIWLEVLCRQHGLGPADEALARITSAEKITQVVLPVFFGKVDASIVTRAGWEVMCELNPQLRRQLRIVAVSPAIVPSLTCFRSGFSEAFKEQAIQAMQMSSTRPGFKQLMALFKSDTIGSEPLAALTSTRALVGTYHQLCGETNHALASGPGPEVSQNTNEGKGK